MTHVPPHLQTTHEQYPDGFPERESDDLLGHWKTPSGTVVVEHHPHGYELHFNPCFDFANCDACAPDRGPSNPHTPDDGHHFRECENRAGPILTVAADKPETVLEYLAEAGSTPHVRERAELIVRRTEEEAEFRRLEQEENEQQAALDAAEEPSVEERFAALEAEFAAFRERYGSV